MPPRAGLTRPLVVLALPGMYLLYKYNQYRQQQMEVARRRVTERELLHLNTKIIQCCRRSSRKDPDDYKSSLTSEGCSKACVDLPPEPDCVCPVECPRKPLKPSFLHRIVLRIMEGGSNFGTPWHRVKCPAEPCTKICEVRPPELRSMPPPPPPPAPAPGDRVTVAVLGADTILGQYLAMLLKQCKFIKTLRLYEAVDTARCHAPRDLGLAVQDLRNVDTDCAVEAYSCAYNEIGPCLCCADIVIILESGAVRAEAPYRERFLQQAPLVKFYADNISCCCPDAWVLVAATPTDCMVPLMAEVFRNNCYYNRRRLIGSMALPEMRAKTIAARALNLEPKYIRIPCVGGTEGRALVPLFSNTVDMFDFDRSTEEHLTDTLRNLTGSVARCAGGCRRGAELSEAYAQARLVCAVAQAVTCRYVPTVHGFVEIDHNEIVSPVRYVATKLELVGAGVRTVYPFPRMNDFEFRAMNAAAAELQEKVHLVEAYCCADLCGEPRLDRRRCAGAADC